ncbi:hypothetical protein NDU88_002674 [Pleurodeles waltl]|uniref:Uncharacterized protein n=1 Tax=Pleurodeles waltl TaxID=8319 RepID=A0AAV7KVE4_PLEWA|nr:hypothetical protein NDU88_002674 [Pleurodeles waltl]
MIINVCRVEHRRYGTAGCIFGSRQVDPDIEDTAANEGANQEEGGVFKPTKASPGVSADSLETDGKDGWNQQRSGGEETPEQRQRSRHQHINPCDALWDGEQTTRLTDWLSSEKSVP